MPSLLDKTVVILPDEGSSIADAFWHDIWPI